MLLFLPCDKAVGDAPQRGEVGGDLGEDVVVVVFGVALLLGGTEVIGVGLAPHRGDVGGNAEVRPLLLLLRLGVGGEKEGRGCGESECRWLC